MRKGFSSLYKFGFTVYLPDSRKADELPESNWTSYASIERPLAGEQDSPIIFFRIDFSPEDKSVVEHDIQAGLLINWLISSRPNDQLSMGINYIALRQGLADETVYEINYNIRINQKISLQPDIQYIHQSTHSYSAATVASIRLNIEI